MLLVAAVHETESQSAMWRVGFAHLTTGGRYDHRAPPPRRRSTTAAPLDRQPRRPRQRVPRDQHSIERRATSAGDSGLSTVRERRPPPTRRLPTSPSRGLCSSRPAPDVATARSASTSTPSSPSTRRSGSCRGVRCQLAASGPARPCRGPKDGPQSGLKPSDRGVPAVSELERLVPDVPILVEDLLLQARQLADSGAPAEAVEAILDHVAALREGRD